MRNYTENADSLLEQYPTKTVPLSKQEEKRIYDMALKKIEKAGSYTPPKLKKHRRVPVCVAAAVAATCVLSAGIAAAPYIKELAGGKIGFFTDAKSQAQVQNVLDAPRGEYGGQQTDTEGHNTEIGQTQTLDGVNYTLDTVSMDAATLDCFFTVSGENVVAKFLDADSIYPEWEQLYFNTPWMMAQINGGEEIHSMQSDFYRQGDDTFRLWLHFQLPQEPQGDTVMLRLVDSDPALGEPGLSYTMELNGEQVRAGARRVAPTVLDFGIADALLGDNPITLDSLCFGTGSGSLVKHSEASEKFYKTHPLGAEGEDEGKKLKGEDPDNPVNFGGEMILTDDTGRELLPSYPDGVFADVVAYTVPAENAQSITFTPVYHSGVYEYEERTVTVDEMQQGVKIATSDAGGYTLQNFAVQGQALTWQMVPYGYAQSCELTPQDEEYIDTNTNSYAMRSSTVDPTTGIISCRIDYYTADPAQVAKISEFRYLFGGGYHADESRAVTLPLQ